MTQKKLDKMIKEAEWQIDYHQKQLIKAHALLEGLKQITNSETNIVSSSTKPVRGKFRLIES